MRHRLYGWGNFHPRVWDGWFRDRGVRGRGGRKRCRKFQVELVHSRGGRGGEPLAEGARNVGREWSSPEASAKDEPEGDAEDIGKPVANGDVATWGEALALLIEGSEEGACHSKGNGRIGQGSEKEAEGGVDGEVHDFVVGKVHEGVDFLNAGCGEGGDAEDEGIEDHAGEEVFPWQLFHKECILGVE